jgi:hypothetical protein
MLDLVLVPFAAALAATVAGAARAEREWPDWSALLAILGYTIALALYVATWRDPEIRTATVVLGTAFGSFLIAAVPLLTYYGLGRGLAGHRFVLALVWLASVVPLGYYLLIAVLLTGDIVSCPPDAYECPL